MKQFDIPVFYKSPLLSLVKEKRKTADKLKKDFSPSVLDFGKLKIKLARHFGFCYGVENAIEIAFKTVADNPGKKIYLLSEMIHNPQVNEDLKKHGVDFIMSTKGDMLKSWDEIFADDIVIIPAFGTTIETENLLREKGIDPLKYNTTCPFVERVWNKAEQIGSKNYTIVIHGKPDHEETRATFSHSYQFSKSIVLKDMHDAVLLGDFILGKIDEQTIADRFAATSSIGFDFETDLQRIGVVNQTTMLAEDTQAIAEYLKQVMIQKYGDAQVKEHFADTRDTLCYATNDNQTAVKEMLNDEADMALVIGGYNSSNTSHLVELCEAKLPTYYIKDASSLTQAPSIRHYDFHHKTELFSENALDTAATKTILISSGASCPDAVVENVIDTLLNIYDCEDKKDAVLAQWASK